MLLHELKDLRIQQFSWDVIDANSYLIVEDKNALLFDAIDSTELMDALAPVKELSIILTHCHCDHICGLNRIREKMPNTVVYASLLCSKKIGSQFKNLSSSGDAFWAFYKNKKIQNKHLTTENDKIHIIDPFICEPAEVTFEGETEISWCGHTIRLFQCEGHTNDSLIVVLDNEYMFTGDTLLPIPTVTRFPSGSTAKFWTETIPKLKSISAELVFPGHGAPGKLHDMVAINKEPERYKT